MNVSMMRLKHLWHRKAISWRGENFNATINASTTMANALGLLVSCFYVFNIEYPAFSKNLFLEAAMMQRTKEAKKRVAINKFLQELEWH